jgi:hypothetical protein
MVPELLVWMQGQVRLDQCYLVLVLIDTSQHHPDWEKDLFTHHLPSIDVWLHKELSAIRPLHRCPYIHDHFLTSATLVDFPQFYDVHHLIPQVLDLRPKHMIERYHGQSEDADKWEIYLKYRQIVFDFLTDPDRSGHLFVGQDRYVRLAKYLFILLSDIE